MDNSLNKLPAPPKGQTGVTLDQFNHLPPPPKGQIGLSPDQIKSATSNTPKQTLDPKTGLPDQQTQEVARNKFGDAINNFFPGKQVGQAIGTLAGQTIANFKGQGDYFDSSAPSPTQVAGDVAQGALTVAAPGANAETTAGRIGLNATLGAGIGSTNAIAQGESGSDVLKQGAIGGLTGGGISAAGEGLNALSKNLPSWLAKAALPKLAGKDTQYALDNAKIGGLQSMAKKSGESIQNYEGQIQGILNHPEFKGVAADSEPILQNALSSFPNSQYTKQTLIKNAYNIAPKVGKLVQKMEAGQANIQELNTIRKELDSATKSVYTSINRPPESKMLGAALSNSIRDYVQTTAPETAPIFQNYSKEIGLNKAIQAAAKKGESRVSLKDIAAGTAGFAKGGLKGSLEAIIAERALTNPGMQLGAAKAIQTLGKNAQPLLNTAFQAGKAPLIKKITNQ